MSLTSIIAFKGEFGADFREILEPIRPKAKGFLTQGKLPAFNSAYPTLAPYRIQAHEAALVGIAFDYLARFILSKHINTPLDYSSFYFYNAFHFIPPEYIKLASARIKDHYVLIDSFFKEAEISDQFIAHLFTLAKFEQIARQGCFDPVDGLAFINSKTTMVVVDDIRKMGRIFTRAFIESKLVTKDSFILFNPTYSDQVTKVLNGIDADIFIDGVLIDFKSTKNYAYDKDNAYQLLGYYLFQLMDKALGKKTDFALEDIEKIAFYKARAGQIEYYDVRQFNKKDVLEALVALSTLLRIAVPENNLIKVVSEMY